MMTSHDGQVTAIKLASATIVMTTLSIFASPASVALGTEACSERP
jgi:hypothetical protein